MGYYNFKCANCGEEESHDFPANDYDKYVTEGGRLKRRRCKKCRTIKLYRHITGGVSVVGEPGVMSLITIQFECADCEHVQKLDIKTDKAFYQIEDQYLDEDKKSKTETCEQCQSDQLFYHNSGQAPAVLGGTRGYMSMERWWRQNPDHAKRKEDGLRAKMADRHRKRVLDKINKQMCGGRAQDRHKDYGEGQSEQKLKSDD